MWEVIVTQIGPTDERKRETATALFTKLLLS